MDEQAAVGEALEAAVDEIDVDELLELQRVDRAERLLVTVDEGDRPADRGHRRQLGDLGQRVGDGR